jgi:hypothetical protein
MTDHLMHTRGTFSFLTFALKCILTFEALPEPVLCQMRTPSEIRRAGQMENAWVYVPCRVA